MRLSEAIRLGAMLRPQGFGLRDGWTSQRSSCAMGAAMEAVGQGRGPVYEVWPWVSVHGLVACPACGGTEACASVIVTRHLNDKHRWPREQIADWVATVEPREVSAPAEARSAEGAEAPCAARSSDQQAR